MERKEEERKYNQFQKLKERIGIMQEQFMILEQRFLELNAMREGLNEIKDRVFIALGSDVFLDSEIKDKENVLVNIGMNIFVKKKMGDAKELMSKQSRTVEEAMYNVKEELEERFNKLKLLQEELNKS